MRWWLLLKILLHPLRFAQERIDRWILARVKRQPGPITIGRGKVYILPTRFGYLFAFMLLVMLLGAMNYSNSMAFLLTFLLSGLGLVCMHHTHANLANLQMRAGDCPPVFAGDPARFPVQIDNSATSGRYSLALSWPKEEAQAIPGDVEAISSTTLNLSSQTKRRGWHEARVFSLSTDFPLGLFHAWTWAELDMHCLVFPKPLDLVGTPPSSAGHGGVASTDRGGQDEFSGLRNYRRGDAPRSIHWKSFPKLRRPMVKQFAESLDQELWLDWAALNQLNTEDRLSQLTQWVLDAEIAQRAYGLRLPGLQLEPGRGEQHRYNCLKALALFEIPNA